MKPTRTFVRILALTIASTLVSVVLVNTQSTTTWASGDDELVIPTDIPTSGKQDLDLIIFRAGMRHGIDPRFLHAVIWQESKYKVQSHSDSGARGLMRLYPSTVRRFGGSDVNDATQNVEAGTKYLRWLLKRFDGNVSLALAGYDAGEGAVDKYDGVPPYNETQNFVRLVANSYGKDYHPTLTPEEARPTFNLTAATTIKSITITSERGYDTMRLTQFPGGHNKLTVTESVTFESPNEGSVSGRIEVHTVSSLDGREVHHKRIYYAPALNPKKVRKYREPSSPSVEMLPVGAEFIFWAGDGDDPTPISDKVMVIVYPKYNTPIKLQL